MSASSPICDRYSRCTRSQQRKCRNCKIICAATRRKNRPFMQGAARQIRRTHRLRTKGEFAAIAPMAASQKLALPKPRSVRFIRLWSSIIGKSRIGTNQHAYTDYFWHFVHKTKSQWASSIFESHSACSVCLVRSPVHSERRVKCL